MNAHPCAIIPTCAIEAKLLPASEEGDSDVELLLDDDSEVELLEEAGGGDGVELVDDEL